MVPRRPAEREGALSPAWTRRWAVSATLALDRAAFQVPDMMAVSAAMA